MASVLLEGRGRRSGWTVCCVRGVGKEGGKEWMDSVLCEGSGGEGGNGWIVCYGRGEGGREWMDSVTMRLAVRWRGRMFIFRMGMLALDNLLPRCGLTLLYILYT